MITVITVMNVTFYFFQTHLSHQQNNYTGGVAQFVVVSIDIMAYQDLRRLETVSSDFQAFCEACQQLEGRWGINPALRVGSHDSNIAFSVDNVSRRIIPANFRGLSYVPVKSTGDGNCLFNSANLAICQAETFAFELRL